MANYYTFNLKAGVALQAPVRGKLILVDDIGQATGVDITPMLNNSEGRKMPGRKKAFKCWTEFDGLVLQAAVDCVVALFLSDTDVSLGLADGAGVVVSGQVNIGNGTAQRVPVDLSGGNVQVTASNVGINNTDAAPVPVRSAALSNIVTIAPAVVGTGAAAKVVGDATLRRLRFHNASSTAVVVLGASDVTLANAAIRLFPGDTWFEDDAAGATWYATSDTAGADLRMGGFK